MSSQFSFGFVKLQNKSGLTLRYWYSTVMNYICQLFPTTNLTYLLKLDIITDMNKQILSQLEQLNIISTNEAKVYLALLQIGQTSAGEIIRETNLHRSVVYETLDKLIDRKFAFKLSKKKIAYFQAMAPDKILEDIEAKKDLATQLLPVLKKMVGKTMPEITIYEGVDEYRRFWLDSVKNLPSGAIDYVAGSVGGRWLEHMGSSVKQYFQIAQQRKIGWKLIVFDRDDGDHSFLSAYPDFRWEARFIDRNVSKEGNFNVWGDDTLVLHSVTEPMIIEIKNPSLVKVFKQLFGYMWDNGKKL